MWQIFSMQFPKLHSLPSGYIGEVPRAQTSSEYLIFGAIKTLSWEVWQLYKEQHKMD